MHSLKLHTWAELEQLKAGMPLLLLILFADPRLLGSLHGGQLAWRSHRCPHRRGSIRLPS
jgi:hypothetical protein